MRAAIILACIAGPVYAQPCAPRADAVDGLAKRFGEAQTYVGIGLGVWLWRVAPGAVWYWTPLIAGLAGSIPIALVSAHPRLGRALARAGLCRIPEEALPAGGPPVPRALAPVPPYAAQESK